MKGKVKFYFWLIKNRKRILIVVTVLVVVSILIAV